MELVILATAFALSVGTTITLTPVLSNVAIRRGWLDRPDEVRKMHLRPIPPMGGIAIFAGVAAGVAYLFTFRTQLPFALPDLSPVLIIGLVAIVATGFYDDVRGLGFKGKFAVQLIVAYALLHAGYRIDVSQLPFVGPDPYVHALISIPLTLLWIVGTINAVNLIDGLDGLAAGVALIAFACLAAVFGMNGQIGLVVVAIVIAGALLGFLAHNFNPATVFMGDSGSLFLGCSLAIYSLSGKAHADPLVALLVPAVALALPLMDTGLSIVRRMRNGGSVFAPDRDHIHHRLSRIWPQWQAVLVLYAVAGIFGVTAVGIAALSPVVGFGVFAIMLLASAVGLVALGYARLSQHLESNKQTNIAQHASEVSSVAAGVGGDGHSAVEVDLKPNDFSMPNENGHEDPEKASRRRISKRFGTLASYLNNPVNANGERFGIARMGPLTMKMVVAAKHLSVADLGGEAVLLDSLSGHYYGVNETGHLILGLIQEPKSIEAITDAVANQYGIDRESADSDVRSFLKELEEKQLVEVS